MNAIYILSDPDSARVNKYKIGITTRDSNKLLRDYRRSRPEVQLYLFELCQNNKEIEAEILTEFQELRVSHQSGKMSEWLTIKLSALVDRVQSKLNKREIKDADGVIEEVYEISDFIRERCVMSIGVSESCRNLYNDYRGVARGRKLKFLTFCKLLIKELARYHGVTKKRLTYKSDGITYYWGIQLKANTRYCVIL